MIYQKVPRSLYLFDYYTHYTGTYLSGTSALITGISGNGQPYIMFGGFRQIYSDLPIKIEGPYGTVVSKLTNICSPSMTYIYNFNGANLGRCTVGICYTVQTLPYGTNTFKITVDDDVLIYTITRQ